MTTHAEPHSGHHDEHVAHHFDDAPQQFEAARLGMWLFLVTEVLFFGGMFAGYTQYRFHYGQAFLVASHEMSVMAGTINTAVLLTSSLAMALAVRAAQTGAKVRKLLILTWVLGFVFLGVKAWEYYEKFEHHLVPGPHFSTALIDEHQQPQLVDELLDVHESASTIEHDESLLKADKRGIQLFFSFYFAMTGLHAFHMIIGLGLITWLIVLAGKNRFTPEYYTPVEMVGLYWHFVDVIWVFLFPLLYLIG